MDFFRTYDLRNFNDIFQKQKSSISAIQFDSHFLRIFIEKAVNCVVIASFHRKIKQQQVMVAEVDIIYIMSYTLVC